MHRFCGRLVPLAVLLLVVSGCGGDATPVGTPTEPVPVTKVETFTGTLTPNGALSHPFTVTGIGSMEAVLSLLTPDSASPVGLALGTWSGSVCQVVLANDAAIQGTVVVGNLTAVGNFCVRIYDSMGTVIGPQTYQIDVAHR